MCGRFTLAQDLETLEDYFGIKMPPLEARYNIAPTQNVPVLRLNKDLKKECVLLHWGLIPSWAKDPAIGNKMINARSESLPEKPAFRTAFIKRRCLIIADGFYEWQKVNGKKQPYYIKQADSTPFAFAGLWEHWIHNENNNIIESCTIITTRANALLTAIHDRMPVILEKENYDIWLDPDIKEKDLLYSILNPYDSDKMTIYRVSSQVNVPKIDNPDLTEKID